MFDRRVFWGLTVAVALAWGASPAGAAILAVHNEVLDGFAHVDPTQGTVLPTGSSWNLDPPSTRAGNTPGITRSPYDGSTSSADLGGGALAANFASDPNVWKTYQYFATGPSNPSSPATLEFDINQFAFSFLWGSPDTYNSIVFLLNEVPVYTLTALVAGINPAPGGSAWFVSVTDILFDRISFISTSQNALEFANIVTSAVPIPPALLLFGSGLAGFAYLARRRRLKSAVATA